MNVLSAERRDAVRPRALSFPWPVLAVALLFSPSAFAYLDPGTGSVLLQGFLAMMAAVLTWSSLSWQRTKSWLSALPGRRRHPASPDDEPTH